ncbi:MAG: epoxyqueuosine reductase QueH [Bryobacterales bacterium]|nr:epoxyqueuosine reductase QueH [Bryobacterales bacterium]
MTRQEAGWNCRTDTRKCSPFLLRACSGEVMEAIHAGIEYDIFYNPNIASTEEYELRKSENIAAKGSLSCRHDTDNWFERAKDLNGERGRATMCFDMRFERTALYAHEHGFHVITSCLGISRWKNMDQINDSGVRAASRYPGMSYWTYNWRKKGGAARMVEIAKRENFYQQEYCGCVYSLRDTNKWRLASGREKIVRGVKFYGIGAGADDDRPPPQPEIGSDAG